jgi:hypothetical protein
MPTPSSANWQHVISIALIVLSLLLGIVVVTEADYNSNLLIKTASGTQLHWQLEHPPHYRKPPQIRSLLRRVWEELSAIAEGGSRHHSILVKSNENFIQSTKVIID